MGYGLTHMDHCVSNVPNLFEAVDYLTAFTGFHEFGEFTAADVGTVDSGLNSMVNILFLNRMIFSIIYFDLELILTI